MIRVALLDAAGVYQGAVEVADESQLTDHHVRAVPDEAISPGQYRFERDARLPEGGRWVHLAPTARKPARDVPSIEQVLYAMVRAHPNPPAEANAWAAWFETTIEGRAARRKK